MKSSHLARLIYPEYRFGKTNIKEAEKLVEMGVGGFCIYGGGADEITETIKILKSASNTPLLFCADYENGAGQWVKEATELPSNMAVGASGDQQIARRKAEITAIEANALGVDWILAPVVDLASNPENPIINTRAFSDSPDIVSVIAHAYISGLRSQNAVSCLKHFPGHGETSVDSHLALPELSRTREELENSELKPYKTLLKNADAVMIGHLRVASIDPENTASFSKKIITELLRKELKFDGCVVTDAFSMKAISDEDSAGIKAVEAGADILLVPENPFELFEALSQAYYDGLLKDDFIEKALKRQDAMVKKTSLGSLKKHPRNLIGCPEHKRFVLDCSESCIAWAFKKKDELLREGDVVGYFEPLTSPENWSGKHFVEELEVRGVRVLPFDGRDKIDKLIAASFSRPRAYSGKINLGERERREISKYLSLAKESVMISFGSPFVFDEFEESLKAGLCAFCAVREFQITCAKILVSKAGAKGRMPVKLVIKKLSN
ncbi:MAG: hypothetical protein HY746_07485 [Elusimicrobia bacterium]|nr:hypothetical protein [Elusimicrobiota bacterium]